MHFAWKAGNSTKAPTEATGRSKPASSAGPATKEAPESSENILSTLEPPSSNNKSMAEAKNNIKQNTKSKQYKDI